MSAATAQSPDMAAQVTDAQRNIFSIFTVTHTSGETEPSRLDLDTTKKMDELSKMMGIRLMDHVIAGRETFYSFADNGLIK